MATLQDIYQQSYSDMPFADFAQRYHQKFYADMPFDQFMAKAGGAPAPQADAPIAKGDWQGLADRVNNAVDAEYEKGPTSPEMEDAIRQRVAREEGVKYGKAYAEKGAGLINEGVGMAMDKFALGLPRLAEAYMPGFLGGQSALPGAVAHEFLKSADQARAEQNPGTAAAGNLAGIVGQTALMPASAAESLAGRLATSAAQSSLIGGAEKAVESRGDLVETGKGVGFGALGGVLGQGLGEGLVKGGRALVDPLRGLAKSGPADQQATARILLAARNVGIDDATAARKLAELGPDGFIADVLGKHGESLARSSANLSPEARGVLEDASKQRLGGQTDRLVEALRQAGGRAVGATPAEIKDNIALASRPAVRQAYKTAQEAGYDLPFEPFRDLMQSPKVVSALKQAEAEIKDRVAAYGPQEASQLAVYDATKKILDRMGWKEGDDVAKVLASKLRDAVDNNIPEYGGARSLAQGIKKQQEAVDLGVLGAKGQVPPNYPAMVEASQYPRSVAQGYSTTKINDILNRKVGQAPLDMLTGTKAGRDALAAALGPKADSVMKQVGAERQFLSFDRALSGNSSTARQLAELGLVTGAGAAGGYMTGFDPMQAGSIAGLAALGKHGVGKLAEALAKRNEAAVAPEVARKLLDRALPKMVDANGNKLTETARRRLVEALMQDSTRALGYSAGQR